MAEAVHLTPVQFEVAAGQLLQVYTHWRMRTGHSYKACALDTVTKHAHWDPAPWGVSIDS